MDVIYSAVNCAEGVAKVEIEALREKGYLKKLFITGRESDITWEGEKIKIPDFNPGKIQHLVTEKRVPNVLSGILADGLISNLIEDCDFFHAWIGHALFSVWECKSRGIKTIVERGSPPPEYQNEVFKGEIPKYRFPGYNPLHPLEIQQVRKAIENADIFLINSEYCKELYLKYGYKLPETHIIYRGVDIDRFKVSKKPREFRIISVITNPIRKGLIYLLKAWNELNLNGELMIVGIGTISNIPNVKFIPWADDIEKYYQNSSLFVLPSLDEGFVKACIEAMSCGLPVISTKISGIWDICKDGKEGFIIPERDIGSIKEKIQYFYDNQGEIKKMGKNARKTVEKYFTKGKFKERYLTSFGGSLHA